MTIISRSIRRLPDAEQEVMQAVWACQPPISRADIEEQLPRERTMAPTTLLTLLTRLSEKGFLTIEKNGRRSCYTPCISQEDYLAFQSKTFFQKLCGGSVAVFANALCDSGLSREELDQLRGLLESAAEPENALGSKNAVEPENAAVRPEEAGPDQGAIRKEGTTL